MTTAARRDGLITHARGAGGLEPPVGADLDGHLRRHRNALIATTSADGAPQLHDRARVAPCLHHLEEPRRAQSRIVFSAREN